MTIHSAIEKAIQGGWDFTENVNFSDEDRSRFKRSPHLKEAKTIMGFWGTVLLDPLFWQALGKVEGWHKGIAPEHEHLYWKAHWHAMVDALAEGKTIEQFFETL